MSEGPTARTVLLVEDDEATAELERRALVRAGHNVRIVNSVGEAVALLAVESFDAVLLDYHLPDGDPWRVLDAASARVPRTPVVIVTGMGNEHVAAEALHHGAAEYVRKDPTFWDQLPAVVERVARSAQVEEQLRRTDAVMQLIAEHASDIIGIIDAAGYWRYISPSCRTIVGYEPHEMVGQKAGRTVHPDDVGQTVLAQFARSRDNDVQGRYRVRRKDGEWIWLETRAHVERDATSGEAQEYVAVSRDITAQVAAEESLKEERRRLEEAQRIAHLGSFEMDIASGVTRLSSALYDIVGIDPKDLVRNYESFLSRVHPEDRARIMAGVEDTLRTGEPFEEEYRISRPNGEMRVLHANAKLIRDEAGKPAHLAGTARDVTDERALRQQLVFADRMASVGTLAAGVAHEINNPLAYVMANLDFIVQLLHEERASMAPGRMAELEELVNEARDGAERVRRIVRDLKTFSRADVEHRERVDVTRVLDVALNIAYNEVRHRARVVKEFGPAPLVLADESQLAQVFINLIVNAGQAMPEGRAALNELRLVTSTDARGQAMIEVKDTGPGIPESIRAHIFDPFFTTKRVGEGTGLGLSICHGIVSGLGGEITCESQPDVGTTFRVVLPPAHAEEPSVAVPASTARPSEGRRGRVLVVDDEPMIRTVVTRLLRGDHDIVTAASGREALHEIGRDAAFDVIVCDLMMPDITGMELYEELAQHKPLLAERMIFLTGGAFTPRGKAFLDSVQNPRLEKPFDHTILRALVRNLVR